MIRLLFSWKKGLFGSLDWYVGCNFVHDDPLSVQIDQFSESTLKAIIIQLSKGKEWFS